MERRRIQTPYYTDDTEMYLGRYTGERLGDIPHAYWRTMLLHRWFAERHHLLWEYACRRCPNCRAVSVHD